VTRRNNTTTQSDQNEEDSTPAAETKDDVDAVTPVTLSPPRDGVVCKVETTLAEDTVE